MGYWTHKVTRRNRKDNQDFNNNIIQEANSEGELWKITNDVINLKTITQLNFKSMVKKLKTKKQKQRHLMNILLTKSLPWKMALIKAEKGSFSKTSSKNEKHQWNDLRSMKCMNNRRLKINKKLLLFRFKEIKVMITIVGK